MAKQHVLKSTDPAGNDLFLTAFSQQGRRDLMLNWNTNASVAVVFDSEAKAQRCKSFLFGADNKAVEAAEVPE